MFNFNVQAKDVKTFLARLMWLLQVKPANKSKNRCQ